MENVPTIVEMFVQYAWIGWLVLIAVFLVIEMLTLDFTFLMLALGGTAGLIAGLFDAPIWLQFIVAGIGATILILFLRPPLLKRLHRNQDPAKSNVEALIGLGGVVLHDVTPLSGQVKLSNGDIWTARGEHAAPLPQGSKIVVAAIEGATAIVRPSHD